MMLCTCVTLKRECVFRITHDASARQTSFLIFQLKFISFEYCLPRIYFSFVSITNTPLTKQAASPVSLIFNVISIKLTQMYVPVVTTPSNDVKLICKFNLGQETLYSIKWYKDGVEFYRYVPKARPKSIAFNNRGIQVDLNKSNSEQVYLNNVNTYSAGEYRCEASGESPAFRRQVGIKTMTVHVIPHKRPIITGNNRIIYKQNMVIEMNCTSQPSLPAANLYWFINNEKVSDEWIKNRPTLRTGSGLYITSLTLNLKLSSNLWKDDEMMNVSCLAEIDDRYSKSSSVIFYIKYNLRNESGEPPYLPFRL
ncbi:hypothetical protein GQR58_023000 [Nymphon striatum]|nr:hypothetical protein GQR58_023000 [Nymphon striatum]